MITKKAKTYEALIILKERPSSNRQKTYCIFYFFSNVKKFIFIFVISIKPKLLIMYKIELLSWNNLWYFDDENAKR